MQFAKGDAVAYRTRDRHGDQWICAIVKNHRKTGQVEIVTADSDTWLLIPEAVLTKIKTVWADTMLPVSRASLKDKP